MKHLFRHLYLFVLLLFFSTIGHAQLYPVQLTSVFTSPYSVKISDYATSMDTKLQLFVNPTDVTMSQRQVRLKLYIQGNGLHVQSSDFIQGQRPIFINGGELQTLTNVDIAPLFRLENLQGISPQQYANGLPEGMYNFCFEMYDLVTNQKISQKSCTGLYLILNDPPILNTPQRNEQIASTEFPNILFTWTPRQRNATNVSYKFELKQLLDPTLDPQIAFQMSPVLYEETLFGTALLYNLSMPILTPGLRYAWRVKAISTTGLSENAVFKNDGYSEIYSFKYTASCAAPTFLLSETQSSKSVKITWEGVPEHTRYQVQYKKQGVRNAQWFSSNSLNRQSLITNLEPGLTYEFRVGSSCDPVEDGVQSFTYSGINTFTTAAQTSSVATYNCGIVPQINIQNQKPLTNLIQSETFKAGDFPVTILELKGENSPYSGRGYIVVPYLADTKIAVEFNNIVINTDYQLISGVVETSYNPDWKNVGNVEDFTGEGQGGQIEEAVSFEVKDIVVNTNGDILVNGKDGQQVTIPGGKDTVITDSKGNTYTVDKNGNGSNEPVVAAAGGKPTPENTDGVDKNGQATALTAKGITIAFSNNEDTSKGAKSKYAFDVITENAPIALKNLYKKVDNKTLPYKAVLNGDSDTMLATVTVTDASIKLDDIVFKTQNGASIQAVRNDKVFVLTVKGNLSYAEEQILATIKQGNKWQTIGAFMLVHISPKEVNVALVPTDATSQKKLDGIIAETQKIYNKVGVKINFKKEEVLNINSVVSGNTIQTEKNTLTSTYSTDQQAINNLYQSTDNSYVLFVTEKASSTGQQGYMRLNGQFGYVFNSGLSKTPAHELGHGIFKLEHPFEKYKTADSGTDLLMDYSSGTTLNHLDWKQINDPAFKLYAFQSQSSGEYKVKNLNYICVNDFYKHKPTKTYYDLDGNKILLKSNYAPYAFVGEDKSGHKGQLAIIKNVDTGELYYPIDSKDETEKHGYRGYDAYNKFSIVFQGSSPSKEQGTLVYANSKCEYFENDKSLGINQNCNECVGLPKNAGSIKNNVFTINELTFKLPDEYSVIASDKNEITDKMSIIIDNDRRDGRKDKEDQRSDVNLLPSDKKAEDIYKEVATLWNNYENDMYQGKLMPGIDEYTIGFSIEKDKLDKKKLLMPELISNKVLDKITENFIKVFFQNKIKGYLNMPLGLVSFYNSGKGNENYEQAGFELVNHFYNKTGNSYYKTKTIADAIYQTKKGKESIDNMIKLVDQVFQYKMNKPKKEWNSGKFLDRALDNDWFLKGIDPETFPRFEVSSLLGTDEEKLALFCIGGTQAVKIGVKEFKPVIEGDKIGYEATIVIQYLDTFGVSESDYTKDLGIADYTNATEYNYRGGVMSQWILQHQYGYTPFNDFLTYNIKMKKLWKK